MDIGYSYNNNEISYALSLICFQIEDLKTFSSLFSMAVHIMHNKEDKDTNNLVVLYLRYNKTSIIILLV